MGLMGLWRQKRKAEASRRTFLFEVENVRREQRWQPKILTNKQKMKRFFSPIYPPWREGFKPVSCYDRSFVDGTRENAMFRLLRNIFFVELFGLVLYTVFSLKYASEPHKMGTYIAIIVHSALSIMIICPTFMKYMVISIQRMLGGKLRMLILLLVMSLTVEFHLMNATKNVATMAGSMSCVENTIRQVKSEFQNNLANIKHNMNPKTADEDDYESAKERESHLKLLNPFKEVHQFLREFQQVIGRTTAHFWKHYKHLFNITTTCKKLFVGPYMKCHSLFNKAFMKCDSEAETMFGTELCAFIPRISVLCNALRTVTDNVCTTSQTVGNKFSSGSMWVAGWTVRPIMDRVINFFKSTLVYKIGKEAKHMRNMSFHLNGTTGSHGMKLNDELKRRLMAEVQGFIDLIGGLDMVIKYILLPFTLFYPFIISFLFIFHYKTDEAYKNVYINDEIKKIERDRVLRGEGGIFPLSNEEADKYTYVTAWRLSIYEKMKMLLFFGFTIVYMGAPLMFIALDFVVYEVSYATFNVVHNTRIELPDHYEVDVTGKGLLMTRFLKGLFDMFNPLSEAVLAKDARWRTCFVEPNVPDYNLMATIIWMLIFALILCRFQCWLVRQSLTLADYFYPDRVRPRALYLYNHILFERRMLKTQTEKVQKELLAHDQLAGRDELVRRGVQSRGKCFVKCEKCYKELRVKDSNNTRLCVECGVFYCIECFSFRMHCKKCGSNIQMMGPLPLYHDMDSEEEYYSGDQSPYHSVPSTGSTGTGRETGHPAGRAPSDNVLKNTPLTSETAQTQTMSENPTTTTATDTQRKHKI